MKLQTKAYFRSDHPFWTGWRPIRIERRRCSLQKAQRRWGLGRVGGWPGREKTFFLHFFAHQVILSNAILRPDRQLCSLSKRNQLWTRWEASDLNFLLILDGNTRHPIFKAENTTSWIQWYWPMLPWGPYELLQVCPKEVSKVRVQLKFMEKTSIVNLWTKILLKGAIHTIGPLVPGGTLFPPIELTIWRRW